MRTGVLIMTASIVLAGQALAQSAGNQSAGAGATVPASSAPSDGVVKPGATVDPGMTVIRPKMPPGSTPVIKPRTTTPDGAVVVPK